MTEKLGPMAEAVRAAYAAGEEDEAMQPRVLVDDQERPLGKIGQGEPVIFYDLRGEREVQLTQAFTESAFKHFDTKGMTAPFCTLIEYSSELKAEVAFPPIECVEGTLCEAVSNAGHQQVKLVETEKAVHLSYFINGKREDPFPGEERVLLESVKEESAALRDPAMMAAEVTDRTIECMADPKYKFITVNLANVDVIAHIEDKQKVLNAVSIVDTCIGRILASAKDNGITTVLTADHGTAESWLYSDGQIDTGHTKSPVPVIVVDDALADCKLRSRGALTDVAPTVLSLMGIDPPNQMTGRSLIEDSLESPDRRVLLLIADGWGYNADAFGNLIHEAQTPVMDGLYRAYSWTTLEACGEAVGMPEGSVGNSEVGHLHIGAGRLIHSDRVRVNQAIADGSFFSNPAFAQAMEIAVKENLPLHLLGIVSFYSSHGSLDHLFALMKMARDLGVKRMYLHSLLGRRGERPEAGARYIGDVEAECKRLGLGQVVTVIGRYWALDREHNWDRIEKTYRAMVDGEGVTALNN